jgi:hypothetical protein
MRAMALVHAMVGVVGGVGATAAVGPSSRHRTCPRNDARETRCGMSVYTSKVAGWSRFGLRAEGMSGVCALRVACVVRSCRCGV